MMQTLYTHTLAQPALASASHTTGTVNGITVDTAVYNNHFRDVTFVVLTGAVTDGTHTFSVEESANDSDWTAVDASRVFGSAVLTSASDNVVKQFGCRPTKRYVRCVSTVDTGPGSNVYGVVALLGSGSDNPVKRA